MARATRDGVFLTDKFVRAVKPSGKRQQIADAWGVNLFLIIQPSGHKSWAWRGRMGGKPYKATLGAYPAYSLLEARNWSGEVTDFRDRGINIIKVREEEARQASLENEREAFDRAMTCDVAFKLYMEQEGCFRKTAKEKWRIYNREISPTIGDKRLSSISYYNLAPIIRKKYESAPIQSNRIQALIRRWFRWSVTHGRSQTKLTSNPSIDLIKLATPNTRSRYLNDFECAVLIKVLCELESLYAEPYQFILYTGTRRSEAFGMLWSELGELDSKGVWTLSRERSKNGEALVLPLPAEMIAMLQKRRFERTESPYVWPSQGRSGGAMSGFYKALSLIQERMQKYADAYDVTIPRWTTHDLRRTLITEMHGLLNEEESPLIPSDVIFRISNHKPQGVRAVYNRYSYFTEKKRALRIWAQHLANLKQRDLGSFFPTVLEEIPKVLTILVWKQRRKGLRLVLVFWRRCSSPRPRGCSLDIC